MAGLMPTRVAASRRRDRFSDVEEPVRRRPSLVGVTGPSVVRSGTADPEVEPQWLALIVHAGVFEWPRAVSGCLTPAAIVIHRPGAGRFVLWPVRRQPRSEVHVGLRPTWRVATDRHRR